MSLIRKSIQGLGFNTTKVVLNFFSNIIIANILCDSAAFGLTFLALSMVDFLTVFLSIGLSGALVRYSEANSKEGTLKAYLTEVYGFILILQAVFITLMLLFPKFWSNLFLGSTNYELIYFVAFYTPLRIIRQLIFSTFWGLNDFVSRGKTEILAPSINLIFLLTFILFNKSNYGGLTCVIFFYILSEFISVLILNRMFNSKIDFNFLRFSKPILNYSNQFIKNLKYSMWSLTAALILTAMTVIDRISISAFVSHDKLGKYLVVYGLSSYFIVLVTVISNVLLTNYIILWKTNQGLVIYKLKRTFYFILAGITVMALLFSLILDAIIAVLYGEMYSGLEFIFPYLFITIIFQINYMIFGNLSAIAEKPRITTYALIPGFIINLIGNLIFVPVYGIKAVVFTGSLSYLFISFTIHLLFNLNKIRIGYTSFSITLALSIIIYLFIIK